MIKNETAAETSLDVFHNCEYEEETHNPVLPQSSSCTCKVTAEL